MWEVESASEIITLPGHSDAVYTSCFLGDDSRVVSGSYDRTVKVWDIGGVTKERKVSEDIIRRAGASWGAGKRGMRTGGSRLASTGSFAVRPDGAVGAAAAAGDDGTTGVAGGAGSPVAGGDAMSRLSTTTAAGAAGKGFSFGADARRAPRGRGGRNVGARALQIAMEESTTNAPAGAHGSRVTCAVVSRDGTVAVTGSADHEIKVWDTVKGAERYILLGHQAEVTALCMTADGRFLFSGDDHGVLMVRLSRGGAGRLPGRRFLFQHHASIAACCPAPPPTCSCGTRAPSTTS